MPMCAVLNLILIFIDRQRENYIFIYYKIVQTAQTEEVKITNVTITT